MVVIPSLAGWRSLGLIMALGGMASACGSQSLQSSIPTSVPVQTQTIKPGTVENSSEFSGILEAEQRVDLSPR